VFPHAEPVVGGLHGERDAGGEVDVLRDRCGLALWWGDRRAQRDPVEVANVLDRRDRRGVVVVDRVSQTFDVMGDGRRGVEASTRCGVETAGEL